MQPPYRFVYRLTVPLVVTDILRTPWVQITRSTCLAEDRFDHSTENRVTAVHSYEYGLRVQIGKWSISWVLRALQHLAAYETSLAVAE